MLRVLTGTRRGWLGTYRLQPAFLDALGRAVDNPCKSAQGIGWPRIAQPIDRDQGLIG